MIFDSRDGLTLWTPDEAREIEDFKDFPWDDTLIHVNEMTLSTGASGPA